MKHMKVLFLDIDGVLNSHDWWLRRRSRNLPLDPVAVRRLDELVIATGCVVVLSSTWAQAVQSQKEDLERHEGRKRWIEQLYASLEEQ